MGINFVDSIVVYNKFTASALNAEYYVGTRYDNVRVEITQGANITASGISTANSVRVKIPTESVKNYLPADVWQALVVDEKVEHSTFATNGDFFCIAKKPDLSIDNEPPVGVINSDDYERGFLTYMKRTYGMVYTLKTLDVYQLIPRFELGGV